MKRFFNKYYKWIAGIIGVSLIAQMFIVFVNDKAVKPTSTESIVERSDDSKIAADISNMTGVKVEEILKLKQANMSWNEVLDKLKNVSKSGEQNEKSKRNSLLAEAGIEEIIQKLQDQGFKQEEILTAKMLAERLQFQLKEIADDAGYKPQTPLPELGADKKKDEKTEALQKIAEQFDIKTAIYFMLVLRKDFGSPEEVLDEYLLSLQLGLNLEDYIRDKEKYLQDKDEKSIQISRNNIITMSVIELTVLENIQKNNSVAKDEPITAGKEGVSAKDSQGKSLLPDVSPPQIKNLKPGNPAEDVMKEIRALNPN